MKKLIKSYNLDSGNILNVYSTETPPPTHNQIEIVNIHDNLTYNSTEDKGKDYEFDAYDTVLYLTTLGYIVKSNKPHILHKEIIETFDKYYIQPIFTNVLNGRTYLSFKPTVGVVTFSNTGYLYVGKEIVRAKQMSENFLDLFNKWYNDEFRYFAIMKPDICECCGNHKSLEEIKSATFHDSIENIDYFLEANSEKFAD